MLFTDTQHNIKRNWTARMFWNMPQREKSKPQNSRKLDVLWGHVHIQYPGVSFDVRIKAPVGLAHCQRLLIAATTGRDHCRICLWPTSTNWTSWRKMQFIANRVGLLYLIFLIWTGEILQRATIMKIKTNSMVFPKLFQYVFITGGRSSTSVNGDIAIQWEWSNFDHS